MTIAFLSAKSDGVVYSVSQVKDSIELVGGTDLVEFLSETRERNEFFDRVVISENALTEGNEEQDFLFLKEYIEDYSPNLEVILAVSRDSGSQLSDIFLNVLSAPMYSSAYLPSKTSIRNIIDLLELPVLEVKAKYYSLDDGSVKSKEREAKKEKSPSKEKKQGFFGKLFGSKAKEVKQEKEPKDEGNHVVTSPFSSGVAVAESNLNGGVSVTIPNPTSAPQVQQSIDKLFNPSESLDEEDLSTGDLDLNFGEYGESHYQTGYIAEEDEPFNSSGVTIGNSSDWSSIDGLDSPVGVSKNSSFSDFRDFYQDTKSSNSVEQNFGTSPSRFLGDLLPKNTPILPLLGVTLVVGDDSSKFIAHSLNQHTGYYVIDTRSDSNLVPYIEENSYHSSDATFYEENGNFYVLNVSLDEIIPLMAKANQKIVVNVSLEDIDSLGNIMSSFDNVIMVFNNDIHSFESQLLSYEFVSPRVSRAISKGKAVVIGGISKDCFRLLNSAVFSRINWKGLVS